MRLDLVIPAYNEELIIEQSARRVLEFAKANFEKIDWSLCILINGSNDNSPQVIEALCKKEPQLSLVVYKEGGRGRALRRYWQNNPADITAYMDSDLAVKLEALVPLVQSIASGNAELAVGSRYAPDARVERSWLRELISRSYNSLGQLILGNKTRDLQCGFKAIKVSTFKKIAPFLSNDADWFFDTELIAWSEHFKLPVAEIPVDWHETRLGKRPSKVRLWRIPQQFIRPLWRLRQRIKQSPPVLY